VLRRSEQIFFDGKATMREVYRSDVTFYDHYGEILYEDVGTRQVATRLSLFAELSKTDYESMNIIDNPVENLYKLPKNTQRLSGSVLEG
jgi:hypothetical protein